MHGVWHGQPDPGLAGPGPGMNNAQTGASYVVELARSRNQNLTN